MSSKDLQTKKSREKTKATKELRDESEAIVANFLHRRYGNNPNIDKSAMRRWFDDAKVLLSLLNESNIKLAKIKEGEE